MGEEGEREQKREISKAAVLSFSSLILESPFRPSPPPPFSRVENRTGVIFFTVSIAVLVQL